MTKFTKERLERVISLDDIYDPELTKAMARQLLASMEQEPVGFEVITSAGEIMTLCKIESGKSYEDMNCTLKPVYAAPQLPQPVVPDESAIFDAAIDICRKSDSIDEHAWNHGVLAVMSAFRHCRAAMLQAGNSPVIPDGWVACSERMPEKGERDIWLFNGEGVYHGYVWDNYEFVDWNEEYNSLPGVTHLMPMTLPAAPQQEPEK